MTGSAATLSLAWHHDFAFQPMSTRIRPEPSFSWN
jgi:hypothetical protein